jgi:Zn-dependent peptidase ImmA (M78 family)
MDKEDSKVITDAERRAIRNKADDIRYSWAKKGFCDIFSILDNRAILIRKPIKGNISGFTTYFKDEFIVVLNSNFTLGHEIYSGAHELYHLSFNQEILKRERILTSDEEEQLDNEATIFAAEFLMPEDGVRDLFEKLVFVMPDQVEPRQVIRLQNKFKVSYAAMLKRLVYLGLCDHQTYKKLREFGTVQHASELRKVTIKEGFNCNLIEPSKVSTISAEYLQAVRNNYEKGKISFGKLTSLLDYLGQTPETYGYFPEED